MKIIVIFLFIVLTYQQLTTFKNKDGHNYDFTNLVKSPYWEVKEQTPDSGLFTIAYVFNFGPDNQPTCEGKEGSYEALDVMGQLTDSCDLLGSKGSEQIQEMQDHQGLIIRQTNGEKCQASENESDIGNAKSITFKIFCKNADDSDWKISPVNSDSITSCNVELKINHSAGCYTGFFRSWSFGRILKWGLFILIVYLAVGYYNNRKNNNLSGFEAVPHSEFWKNLPQKTIEVGKNSFNFVKLKIQKNQNKDEEKYQSL